jgi:hypothetical protein
MKLTHLFNEILNERLTEAITSSDLKNFGSKITQGITNVANRPINVNFNSKKDRLNLSKIKDSQRKIEKLGADVDFNVPLSDTFNVFDNKYDIKSLGPFSASSSIPNLSYLMVSPNDIVKMSKLKKYYRPGDFVEDTTNNTIKINNFRKYKTPDKSYVYVYPVDKTKMIIYYSKQGFGTYFYTSKDVYYSLPEDITDDDIEKLTEILDLVNTKKITIGDFKKITISNPQPK